MLSISPDGLHLAAVARGGEGDGVWWRPLNSLEGTVIPDTTDARNPFWSPDSQQIAYFARGALWRVSIPEGSPLRIVDVEHGLGTWGSEGTILFGGLQSPLYRVDSAGGEPTQVTTFEGAETAHRSPHFLPDGRRFLFHALPKGGVFLGSLDGGRKRLLTNVESEAVYVNPGYLLFVRDGSLLAQKFDEREERLVGIEMTIASNIETNIRKAGLSVSDTGTLIHSSGMPLRQLTWVDRNGQHIERVGEPGSFAQIALSPDETRLVMDTNDGDLTMLDLRRAIQQRFTSEADGVQPIDPVWLPDNRNVVFTSPAASGAFTLYRKALGGDSAEQLLEGTEQRFAEGTTADGGIVYLQGFPSASGQSVWILPPEGSEPYLVYESKDDLDEPQVSPNGKWLTYMSIETDQYEVYVRPVEGGSSERFSLNGGAQPRWRADSQELFFLALDGTMMAVDTSADDIDQFGPAKPLFDSGLTVDPIRDQYVVSRDGERYLLNLSVEQPTVTVVLNWINELADNQ